jgi:hypothetical protein
MLHMSLSPVTIPTPPNSNLDRGMFVWLGTAGGSQDVLATTTLQQALLNWCSNHGVNVIFLDMWGYLGGGNWSTAHAATFQQFIHVAHASGIRVMALSGNNDWGHNQQWVMNNVVRHIANYQAYCDNNTTYPDAKFDGVCLDAEYWTLSGGYTVTEPIGMCDLMVAMRRILNIPIGFCPTWWLADSSSAALSFSYAGGPVQLEGLNLMQVADFCVVQCYSNQVSGAGNTQVSMFQPWFNFASQTGLGLNCGLFCASLTDSGQPAGTSYWTGQSGALAAMEANHTTIANTFMAAPNTNACFRGQAIEQYNLAGADSYKDMT